MNRHYRPGTILGSALLFFGLLVSLSSAPDAVWAQAKKKPGNAGIAPPPEDANDLSMEVNALRTLYLLRGTDTDLATATQEPDNRLSYIKNPKNKLASCAQKDEKKREPADVSDAYRKVLVDLRAALIALEEEQIEKLDKQLQDLQTAEEPELDDQIEITAEARKKTVEFVKVHFTADQVISYLGSYGKDLPNPRTLLFKAMRLTAPAAGKPGPAGPKPSPEEWKEIRAFTIREMTWMIGGLDAKKGDQTGERVGELLDKAYAMSDAELKQKMPALRLQARAIVDKVGPTALLKHVIEQDVAELLSNPRLIPAAEARLAYLAAKKKAQ
jgi:hypothetical protein